MRYQSDNANDVKISLGPELFLEFAVHIMDFGFFNPIVFCHDKGMIERETYTQVLIGFVSLLEFLDSCGIFIFTNICQPCDLEKLLYKNVMSEADWSENIVCYELTELDCSEFCLDKAHIPEKCNIGDFSLVELYLIFRTGTALNKKAIERLLNIELSDSEMLSLKVKLSKGSGRRIVKRKDNSYEMR